MNKIFFNTFECFHRAILLVDCYTVKKSAPTIQCDLCVTVLKNYKNLQENYILYSKFILYYFNVFIFFIKIISNTFLSILILQYTICYISQQFLWRQ